MPYGSIPGVDKPISRLIQGIGKAKSLGEEAGFALLDDWLARGCNTFDTARIYGTTDKFLGDWIASRGVRDRVVILGKGAHHNSERQRVTPQDINDDLEAALRDLQTEHIELFVLHRDDPSQPAGPIVETLNDALKAGKIGAFGGSNWTHGRLAEANTYAAEHGLTPFALTNPNYSLAEQIAEPWENCITISGPAGEAERAWYREQKMPVFSWSSLAGGFLSGRITRENRDEMAETMKLVARCYYSEPNFERLERAQTLAARKGATVPQVALAFLFTQGLDLYALVGSATGEELQANIDALALGITPAEAAWLDLRGDDPG
jgi:aryl-alcohol dehydrogenase-like predicted oxidoreductase